MKIAIIGAGVSGLASARRAIEYGAECVVFEMNNDIGGIWVYSEEDQTDEYGVPMHSSIYKSLRVNLPTCLMEFNGFKFEPESGRCYPSHEEVLKYLKDFAEKYNLYECIQCKVQLVSKVSKGWKITVKNMQNDKINIHQFDAVMVCNGHHTKPALPYIPGIETFCGDKIHSAYYRKNSPYTNKRILIIGYGPSALDISLDCVEVAQNVYLSCRNKEIRINLHKNIEIKSGIICIDGNFVSFDDGASVEVDSIILCTGYEYHFPFLDPSCEIDMYDNLIIRPLFKKFLSIRHPTMCFIGILRQTLVFEMVDLQARVFMKYLTGEINLPSTESMLQIEEEDHKIKLKARPSSAKYFSLTNEVKSYLKELANFGQTETLPDVCFKIYERNAENRKQNYQNSKKQFFKIVDDNTFTCKLE